jgi:hypothetical protein
MGFWVDRAARVVRCALVGVVTWAATVLAAWDDWQMKKDEGDNDEGR